jgi:Putative binding domain, N-terminal
MHRPGAWLAVVALLTAGAAAQPVDIVNPPSAPNLRASSAFTPRGDAAPLPASSFSIQRGIGVLADDGNSYWPGYPSDLHAPATLRVTPTANNTFIVRRVAYQFDDPSGGTVLFDGAKRPIVGYLDANYLFPKYTLPAPFTFGGKQYTILNISTWGAVAFGDADTTQVNYDPTVVSSMFHIPIVAVWYELFYYPASARVIAKTKPGSVVITWQNVVSRHSGTPCTFQIELFTGSGEMQLSYQSLPVDDGLIGFSTGTETATHQTAAAIANADLPPYLQASRATFDDYGGVIAGITLTTAAPVPAPPAGESYRYTLMINGTDVIGVEVGAGHAPFVIAPAPKIPDFPQAQINSWEVKLTGDTLTFRFPASSLEPYLGATSNWAMKSARYGGAGFVERTITQTLPLTFAVRHSLLPQTLEASLEVPAEVFHYLPGVWDTDRIRESIAAYLASRGQSVDTFRFFPTIYDDGLKHANYAGTYPRQSSVGGVGQIPARTECDCHYGAEFSALSEALADEATTQVALTHELGHECLFYADYRDPNGTVKGLWRDAGVPCFGGAHPSQGLVNRSMFRDSESADATMSVMGGSVSGTYILNTPRFGFSPIEMYFLGLAAPGEVTPITFLQSGAPVQITIDQVIAANGPRTPAYVAGQRRVFRVPTFVVRRAGDTVSDAQLQQLHEVLVRWQSHFLRETGGRARANLTIDGGCSYTLSATSVKTSPAASTGTISVLADPGCAWTASSSDSWISVTAGVSGSGDGSVTYTTAANATSVTRAATLTIAGEAIVVTQGLARRRTTKR